MGVHGSPAYSIGESVFFRKNSAIAKFSGWNCRFLLQLKICSILYDFISERVSEGEKEGRGNEGWRGWPRRQQQVMDGVNAWIESQTVMHSYQLAVKREIDSQPERHGEREEEGWQEDRELVPDSSRPRCVHTQLFGWRWTLLSKADWLFFFCIHRQPPWTFCPSDPPNSGERFSSRLQSQQPHAAFIDMFLSCSCRWVTAVKPLD